jgi:hypothetical protein
MTFVSGATTPLNGTKTHPLSQHAIGVLRELRRGPVVCQDINAGVQNRFLRDPLGALAEFVNLPSPFRTHKGKLIPHMQITQAGNDFLDSLDGSD